MDTRDDVAPTAPDRLDSWKEIAAYLKRDVRTLQRWEKDEGLPVHRLQHGKQGTVYAHRHEIDRWWETRRRDLERASTVHAGRSRLLVAAVAAIALAAVVAWAIWPRAERIADTSPTAFTFSVPLANEGTNRVRVSPDGRELAFSTCCTDRRIWRHSLITNTTSAVPGTQGGVDPFWSPDGKRLAFFTDDNTLKATDSSGGAPVMISEAVGGPIWGGTWSTDGTIVFSAGLRLFRVSAAGGKPEPIAINDAAGPAARRKMPQFLPDGKHLIYFVDHPQHSGSYMTSLEALDGTRLVESTYPAIVGAPSHLLYPRGSGLVAQEIDVNSGRLIGEATLLVPDVAPPGLLTSALVASSNTGVLAFMAAGPRRKGRLTWFDRDGIAKGGTLPEISGSEFLNPAISPDGERVAVNRMDPQTGNWDIWIVNFGTGTTSRLTFSPAFDTDPVWSPDGSEVVFTSTREGRFGLYRKTVDSATPEEPILSLEDASLLVATDWSRDGTFIVFDAIRAPSRSAVFALALGKDSAPISVVPSNFPSYGGQISPDGQWIAYISFDSGINEVFVQRFPQAGPRTQVSSGGGAHPRWSANGRELIYWTPPRGLSSSALTFSAAGVRVSPARTVVDTSIPLLLDSRTQYDVAPDGRMLIRQTAGIDPPTFTVITNWRALAGQ